MVSSGARGSEHRNGRTGRGAPGSIDRVVDRAHALREWAARICARRRALSAAQLATAQKATRPANPRCRVGDVAAHGARMSAVRVDRRSVGRRGGAAAAVWTPSTGRGWWRTASNRPRSPVPIWSKRRCATPDRRRRDRLRGRWSRPGRGVSTAASPTRGRTNARVRAATPCRIFAEERAIVDLWTPRDRAAWPTRRHRWTVAGPEAGGPSPRRHPSVRATPRRPQAPAKPLDARTVSACIANQRDRDLVLAPTGGSRHRGT